MTIGGIALLLVCCLSIVFIYKGKGGKIEISGKTASAATCFAIGAIGLWWLYRIPIYSTGFLILSIVFLLVGILLGYFAHKEGSLFKNIAFTGLAGVALASGFLGMNMLFIW